MGGPLVTLISMGHDWAGKADSSPRGWGYSTIFYTGRLCPLNCNVLSLRYMNKPQTRTFPELFDSLKIHLLVLLGVILQTKMTEFPTLS